MKPRIVITMGDPGGIGPEIILKSLLRSDVRQALEPVVVGDFALLQKRAAHMNLNANLVRIDAIDSQPIVAGQDFDITVFEPADTHASFVHGGVGAANGSASHAYIVAAAQSVIAGHNHAICTAPISKEALFAAGFEVPGHTELLASLCGRDSVRMMLVGGGLRVVLQTIHVALKDVPELLTGDKISESLQMISRFASRAGLENPKIAVCGLNPHAGEAGHFGREEIDIIAPAVQLARDQGLQVTGPLPADTVFHRALQNDFDFVLAMYHDQGLIPVKTLDFHGGVNVTLGLPIIRTSPDHGTAFNIAGRGQADEGSMVAALKYAANLTRGII